MLTAFACLLSLSLDAGPGGLSLADARLTYGPLGPARADHSLLPGDNLTVAFTVRGLVPDATGKVVYRTALEVTGPQGNAVYTQPPRDQEAIAALGSDELRAQARLDIGLDQPPGDYTLKVTVTDPKGSQSRSLTQAFTVRPKAFGLIGLLLTADQAGTAPAGLLGPGESVYVNAAVVGFTRGAGGQPNVTLSLRVLDEQGKPTLAEPFTGTISSGVPSTAGALPVQFVLPLNRPGNFTVELKATDAAAGGQSAALTFPLTVHPTR
jgi:hypothetical protein